jgi:NADPH-dependent curcumin reductase CurA
MAVAELNRRLLVRRRPVGLPVAADFELVREPVPVPDAGAILVRNEYCSLDPAMRGWLEDAPSYIEPIALDAALRSIAIGRVASSRHPDFKVGDWVFGMTAIEDYSLAQPDGFLRRIDPARVQPVTRYLSALGAVGLTAYCGVTHVCRPRPGETMLVTGAAGAVGSLVGQIAKLSGCRVVGVAGGAEKCRRLEERYGFDAAIDYKGRSEAQLAAEMARVAPEGFDIVFENVGGTVLDAALMNLKLHARVALCGLISEYNSTSGPVGARNLWQLIVKRARTEGIFTGDYLAHFGEAQDAMVAWLEQGRLVVDEQLEAGIENALPAFLRLFSGAHQGKLILKIA